MTHYISSLKELYEHPDNGKPQVYLAAFLSKDGTYPILVTKVEEFAAGRYRADCVGFKWGYHNPDKINFTWYSDDAMQREVSRQFFTWYELSEYRFAPANRAVPLPLAIQERCHFLPTKFYRIEFRYLEPILLVNAISENHATSMVRSNPLYAHDDMFVETLPMLPQIWTLKD